jgi:hypothetical protein
MMAINQYGVVFNGRRIVHPGAYDATDASATTVVSGGSLNIPIIIGTAEAGESGKVMWFTDASEVHRQLRGGDLVIAAELMFSPIPEGGGGASVIGLLVANSTQRAEKTVGGLKIQSLEYGNGGNRIQAKLEDGTITGTKKLTVHRWDTEQLEVFDNLGAAFVIQYTGSEPYAEITITRTSEEATLLETKVGADQTSAVTDVSLDLTNERFSTIEDIVQYLNSLSGYVVSYVDYGRNADLPVSKLDAISGADIKTARHMMAVEGDIELQVNKFSELVNVTVTGPLSNFDFTYLTGGSAGTTPSSWSAHFNVVKKHFSDILVVLSDSEAIHAEALTHIQQMELRQQKQMLFTGGAVGETVATVKQRAAALNSSRAVLAYPGIYHKSVGNGKKVLAPYFTAAMIAGRVCGVDASEPITFDYFNLVGLEVDLLAGDPVIDELISAGVCTLERVENDAIRLVQGITTYLGPNNSLFREISVRRGADKLSDTMRRSMEDTFVGKKGLRATASAVETKAIDVLEQAIRDGDITAYRNIVVRFVGSVVYVDYEVAMVEPINFVLITSHFVPDSIISTTSEEEI